MNALAISHLRKSYDGRPALRDLSFEIAEGEFFGFLGPNGAGKSTTIHCITSICKFKDGKIDVFGHDVVHDYRAARQLIGFSPQEFNVDIFSTSEKILWYAAGYFGMNSIDRRKRIAELFKQFNLEEHKDKSFRQLSGGLRRRVILARAMIHNPKLLILDEPTAGVDVELRHELWAYLKKINDEGKTILLTSHYLEEVERLCSRIAIINQGSILTIGSKEEFIGSSKTLEHKYLELVGKQI